MNISNLTREINDEYGQDEKCDLVVFSDQKTKLQGSKHFSQSCNSACPVQRVKSTCLHTHTHTAVNSHSVTLS